MDKKDLIRMDFKWFFKLQTRWSDNDMYGHINNAMYYSYLDTVMSEFLSQACHFKMDDQEMMTVVASSQCDYYQSISYPAMIHIGISVERIGTKSVQYRIGFFKDDQESVSAVAKLTEVWIDKKSGISVKIPDQIVEKFKKF